jgi:UDP-N-acetylmuramate dehydrogenase
LSLGKQLYSGTALKFSYREQHFMKEDEIVTAATFQMQKANPEVIRRDLANSLRSRKAAQPIEKPSCGSVFRNPEGTSAWKLIDQVGLRGHAIGGARISQKHSNYIVNEGGAKMSDVLALIELAKERVKAQLGINLIEEVVVLKPRFL